jgi:hypothetical protein
MKKLDITEAFNDSFSKAEHEREREFFVTSASKEALERGKDNACKPSWIRDDLPPEEKTIGGIPIVPVEASDYKGKIIVDDVSVTYTQEADCVSQNDEIQVIKIFTENNGIARFIVLETERWAISDIDELLEILKDFKQRAGLVK